MPEMAPSIKSMVVSLRWHYPNQVYGSKVTPSSQPVTQAPPRFNYQFYYTSKFWKYKLFGGKLFWTDPAFRTILSKSGICHIRKALSHKGFRFRFQCELFKKQKTQSQNLYRAFIWTLVFGKTRSEHRLKGLRRLEVQGLVMELRGNAARTNRFAVCSADIL